MSSFQRLHKFADLLCQAIPDFDRSSLLERPEADPSAKCHVGRMRSRQGPMRVLFCVSEACDFVPFALVQAEDTLVGATLEWTQHYAGEGPTPPVGLAFDLSERNSLTAMGVAGFVLLKPGMIAALSSFEDGVAHAGERFDPRLVVYLDAQELAQAGTDLPGLMQRFNESGRPVFLAGR